MYKSSTDHECPHLKTNRKSSVSHSFNYSCLACCMLLYGLGHVRALVAIPKRVVPVLHGVVRHGQVQALI